MGLRRLAILLALAGQSWTASAIDGSEIKVSERWSVVGVIASEGGKAKAVGIAVLRQNATKRTFTLSIGDALPTEYGFVLQSVQDKSVVVAKGTTKVTLSFAEGSSEDDAAPTRTSRFLDSYYRGLTENPVEILEPEDGASRETAGGYVPLTRFGGLKGERSRFDLYHGGGSYRFENSGNGDSYVVNYDNASDEDESDDAAPGAGGAGAPGIGLPNGTYLKSGFGASGQGGEPRTDADDALDDSAPAY